MKRIKAFIFLFAFLLCIETSLAAIIYGNVYDLELNKLDNIVVKINTTPKQVFISKNGSYKFEVPLGNYLISAEQYKDNELIATTNETLNVATNGSFVLDLILFPVVEYKIPTEKELGLEESFYVERPLWLIIIVPIVGFIFLALFLFFILKKFKHKHIYEELSKDQELVRILEFIKKEGGRTTQKEIRKHFPSSEAKISLILTELEHKGFIEKIKKGRGNIVILKRK